MAKPPRLEPLIDLADLVLGRRPEEPPPPARIEPEPAIRPGFVAEWTFDPRPDTSWKAVWTEEAPERQAQEQHVWTSPYRPMFASEHKRFKAFLRSREG
jgi:hypothetical protein